MSKSIIGIIFIIISALAYFTYAVDNSTPAIWQTKLDCQISSEPIAASGNYLFWGGNNFKKIFKLFLINSQGQIISESINLPSSPFNPIIIDNNVIVADHARMLRAFSLPNLKVVWEAAGADPFEKAPVKNGKNVLQGCGQSIFCFDSQTGKQLWDITEIDTLKNFAADKVILTIHGYKDMIKPIWKASAYDPEDGTSLWKLDEPLSQATPIFVKNACVLSTKDGEGIVLNQLTGEIKYKTKTKGLTQIKGLEDSAIFISNDSKNILFLSLITGKSWATTIQKDFVGAAQIGSRVIIADKKTARCFDVETGLLAWEKEFGDIYDAQPHRNGIFIVYKKSFTARETYATCLGAETSKNLWLAQGKSIFRKPYPLSEGDLLTNNDGTIRLMPKPFFPGLSNVSMPPINMPDPSSKVNNAFENKAQNTEQQLEPEPLDYEPEPKDKVNPNEIDIPINPNNPLPSKEEKKKQIETEIKKGINKEMGLQKKQTKQEAIPKNIPTVSDQDAGW